MTTARGAGGGPATLAEAHELLHGERPEPDAGAPAWVAFHRRCAEVYATVALVDLARQFEAQACAGRELRQAREIEDSLGAERDGT
jgi:hypothetical protein